MSIPLKDYDLTAAKKSMRTHISFERRVCDDYSWTDELRRLNSGILAAKIVGWQVLGALSALPVEEGGTAAPVGVRGGWEAVVDNLSPELPLVRALMVIHGFPGHPGFHGLKLERADQSNGVDPGPKLEEIHASHPRCWNVEDLEQLIFEGACRAFGESRIEPFWLPSQVYPGSRIGKYMRPLHTTMLYDLTGAFDPAFTRHDALVGEWWLIQPVSPRLDHWQLARKVGLEFVGYLSPQHTDVAGRVVMATYQRDPITDDHRISLLENNKFIAGWQKVLWTKTHPPLSDPAFEPLLDLEGVTEESYGSYKHSSDLPPFPPVG